MPGWVGGNLGRSKEQQQDEKVEVIILWILCIACIAAYVFFESSG